MNEKTIEAVELLLSTCIELRREGRLNAFFNYSPHVDVVEVYARPIGHDYLTEDQPDFLFWKRIDIADQHGDPMHKINALIDQLNSYSTEAAA